MSNPMESQRRVFERITDCNSSFFYFNGGLLLSIGVESVWFSDVSPELLDIRFSLRSEIQEDQNREEDY